ncbi:hypothetical protein A3F27_01235 [Candidatus Kaiserbacteria bacterium RIFCSPHIGHO2_12_FULL_53_13]|uniref:Uncharacterized protein n=1 Tax=Candidatus Kaiserbacteria bacterium RIFCSPHIGHO2_12_FULL_53_13 TaxID=1798502 RepID=A0A1F6E6Q5_9BACT|nr:MAG: hypothetical protein A3F27_01235 [Candidatus Kaiserbacteria bacterium RIFCSPHIGHO2_12_FULL_53_13]OGG74654.1 MAG: hypothetical protein A3A37_00970 [Candidatus Kaiserbacteria bacterium RIFCSPLOWO2_01_FULL_52_36]
MLLLDDHHIVMQLVPMQYLGEVTALAFAVAPTVTLSATKFATPSPPLFTWLVLPTFTGAETFPVGGALEGPVHASAKSTPSPIMRIRTSAFRG